MGAHDGFSVDSEHVVTHYFACLNFAYKGWRWAVTLSHVPGTAAATIDDVVLLPGDEAILPPAWVPWSERLQPGDLGVGDVLPTREDDPRLVPGFTGLDETLPDELTDPLNPPGWELGLGRERILSDVGRNEAVDRWYAGDFGPRAARPVVLSFPLVGPCDKPLVCVPMPWLPATDTSWRWIMAAEPTVRPKFSRSHKPLSR